MNTKKIPLKQRLFILAQYLLPHHLVSRLVGLLAECRVVWLKNLLIKAFIKKFQIKMQEAAFDKAEDYEHFNEFFTRPLKEGVRTFKTGPGHILSPCDGQVSQIGDIVQGRIFQAKGHHFSLIELLGGDTQLAEPFMGGKFTTLYLSPKDYHRIHMPVGGRLQRMTYIPGRLFSVNRTTAENVPELFARNERVVCLFETEHGPMAMILVGAMIVASIETVWAGLVSPPRRALKHSYYDEAARAPVDLTQGSEMGRFKLGSTVILLFGPDAMLWNDMIKPHDFIQIGNLLGRAQQSGDIDLSSH